MKKLASFIVGALALTSAQAVSAVTYTPAGAWEMQGPVTVKKGLTLNCTLNIKGNVPEAAPDAHGTASHGHVLNVTSVTLSGGLCGTVTFSGLPYSTSYTPLTATTGTLTLHNVYVNTITSGNCAGDISGTWDNTAKTLTVNATLPAATAGTADCTVNGVLNLVKPTGGSIS